MAFFFISFFTVFLLANYYVARRVWQGVEFLPRWARTITISLFIICAAAYPAAKGLLSSLNNFMYDLLLIVGSLHFVNLLYVFLIVITLDLVRLIFRNKLKSLRADGGSYIRLKGIISIASAIIVTSLILYGSINSRDIKIKYADFTFPAQSGKGGNYKLLLFSDSHFSSLNSDTFTDNLISTIKSESPDIVLIGGDVIDDRIEVLLRHNFVEKLSALDIPGGVYLCNGNHEYIAGIKDAVEFFRLNNFTNLSDTFKVIDSTFVIAGRDDSSRVRFFEAPRKNINEIVDPAKAMNLPIILLDHQPFNLKENSNLGISFQFSGHTHNGQFFPINLITKLIYEISWGYKKIGNTHFYVSSGVGTWGPPVRIGSDSEVIVLNISFKK